MKKEKFNIPDSEYLYMDGVYYVYTERARKYILKILATKGIEMIPANPKRQLFPDE